MTGLTFGLIARRCVCGGAEFARMSELIYRERRCVKHHVIFTLELITNSHSSLISFHEVNSVRFW